MSDIYINTTKVLQVKKWPVNGATSVAIYNKKNDDSLELEKIEEIADFALDDCLKFYGAIPVDQKLVIV